MKEIALFYGSYLSHFNVFFLNVQMVVLAMDSNLCAMAQWLNEFFIFSQLHNCMFFTNRQLSGYTSKP